MSNSGKHTHKSPGLFVLRTHFTVGPEDFRERGDELLQATDHPDITKIIARKDIRFSNSPIEAINKIFKQYLRYYQPRTLKALEQITALFVHDYGSLRPHGSLKGLIPMEVYTRPDLKMDFRQRIREARAIRIEENRKVNCAICAAAKD